MGRWRTEVEDLVRDVIEDTGGVHFIVNLIYNERSDTRPTNIVYSIRRADNEQVVVIGDFSNEIDPDTAVLWPPEGEPSPNQAYHDRINALIRNPNVHLHGESNPFGVFGPVQPFGGKGPRK